MSSDEPEIGAEELRKELANLRGLHGKLETQNQEIYNQGRELNRLRCLEAEYLQVIEMMTSAEKESAARHETKVRSMEEEMSKWRKEHLEHADRHKLELHERDSQIKELQDHVRATQDSKDTDMKLIDDLNDENASLKDCIMKLSERVEELRAVNEEVEKRHTIAEDTINDLTKENEQLHESYACKEEELHEANGLVLDLQEENVAMRGELERLKVKPSDRKSQGNSLFAEVDDRRLQLQQTITEMKAGYRKLQGEKGIHLRQISELQVQVATLCRRWDEEIDERRTDEEREVNSYKSRIGVLESLISGYKQEISELLRRGNEVENDDCLTEYVKTMTNNKNKEIGEHRARIDDLSSSRLLLCRQVKEANAEIRKWRAEVTRLRTRCELLQTEMEKLKLDGEKTKKDEPHAKRSVAKDEMHRKLSNIDVSRQIRKSKVDKENVEREAVMKAVQFSEDTREPKITNRDRLRRGGQIVQVQSIHIPSVKKKAM